MIKSEFTGESKVKRREYNDNVFYSLTLSHKDMDGNWDNGRINARFKKGVDIPDGAKIKIKKAWLDFYKKKDEHKTVMPFIFVLDYEILESPTTNQSQNSYESPSAGISSGNGDFQIIDDDDLPF